MWCWHLNYSDAINVKWQSIACGVGGHPARPPPHLAILLISFCSDFRERIQKQWSDSLWSLQLLWRLMSVALITVKWALNFDLECFCTSSLTLTFNVLQRLKWVTWIAQWSKWWKERHLLQMWVQEMFQSLTTIPYLWQTTIDCV